MHLNATNTKTTSTAGHGWPLEAFPPLVVASAAPLPSTTSSGARQIPSNAATIERWVTESGCELPWVCVTKGCDSHKFGGLQSIGRKSVSHLIWVISILHRWSTAKQNPPNSSRPRRRISVYWLKSCRISRWTSPATTATEGIMWYVICENMSIICETLWYVMICHFFGVMMVMMVLWSRSNHRITGYFLRNVLSAPFEGPRKAQKGPENKRETKRKWWVCWLCFKMRN